MIANGIIFDTNIKLSKNKKEELDELTELFDKVNLSCVYEVNRRFKIQTVMINKEDNILEIKIKNKNNDTMVIEFPCEEKYKRNLQKIKYITLTNYIQITSDSYFVEAYIF